MHRFTAMLLHKEMGVASLQNTFLEIYQYREVLFAILSRELKLKYKRTSLGYLWSLLNPILQMAVLAAVFSHIVNQAIHDYTLYLFSGLLAWNFFSTTVQTSSRALLENENFIKKIYLPKIIFPLSKLCLRGIEFLFSLAALTLIGLVIGLQMKATVLLLPFAMILLCLFTLGISLVVAVATVYFRDVEYLVTVFMQLLYFATPVMYPVSLLPQNYRFVLSLNPLYSQIQIFHALIYEGVVPSASLWGTALSISLVSLLCGLIVLLRCEDELVFRM